MAVGAFLEGLYGKMALKLASKLLTSGRLTSKKLKDVMKQAYYEGKKPRFRHGNLYIDSVPSWCGSQMSL